MKKRTLGRSGVQVSAVGLGCNGLGGRIDLEASREVIHKALDIGITLFDTAANYGHHYGTPGGSESCLGQFLGDRRKDIVLATKFGNPVLQRKDGTPEGASRRHVMLAVEASLKRLQTDWIDLYQIHRPDPLTPIEETLRALDDLIRQGKIRYTGCSNFSGWQAVEAHWTAKHSGLNAFITCQNEYSLVVRDIERDLIPAMQSYGLGLLPYYPLAAGLLTGKYTRSSPSPAGARLTGTRRLAERYLTDANWAIIERLEQFCASRNRSLLELAFSWLLAQPAVSSVIAGATRPEQLELNVRASDWELTAKELAEIDQLYSTSLIPEDSHAR